MYRGYLNLDLFELYSKLLPDNVKVSSLIQLVLGAYIISRIYINLLFDHLSVPALQ